MMNGTEMMEGMHAMGGMGFPMGLTMVFLWALILGLLGWVLYRLVASSDTTVSSQESPLDVLQRRYAAGEISSEEYEERKDVLSA